MHARVERPWPHERVRRDEVIEPVTAHTPQHVRCEWGLKLKYARRPPGPQHVIDLRVIERDRVNVERTADALLDGFHRIMDHGESR